MKFFSANLRFLRKQRGLTQDKIPGVSPSNWSNYENGFAAPTLSGFVDIAKFFDVSESDLLHVNMMSGNTWKLAKNKGAASAGEIENYQATISDLRGTIGDLRLTVSTMEKIIDLNEKVTSDLMSRLEAAEKKVKECEDRSKSNVKSK